MNIAKLIFDLIFFRHPVIVLVLSFLVLYLAGLLNTQNEIIIRDTKLAIKNGPPAAVRIESVTNQTQSAAVHELNLLAEIDPADRFQFTVDTNSTLKNTKYIVPLYAATNPVVTDDTATTPLQTESAAHGNILEKTAAKPKKKMIGAIISDSQDVYNKVLQLSDSTGQIGPIVTVNGQLALFDTQHEKMARQTLTDEGIRYSSHPIYIDAFFDSRNIVLRKQIETAAKGNAVYIIAYVLMAIAYIRCLWQMIAIARGLRDPSLVNAAIKQFDNKPQLNELSFKRKPAPADGFTRPEPTARVSLKSDPFSRISRPEKPAGRALGSVFGHKARKI